jgi:hypothetical protein
MNRVAGSATLILGIVGYYGAAFAGDGTSDGVGTALIYAIKHLISLAGWF